MNLVKLPLGTPLIRTFQYLAYPLSILSSDNQYLPWFYSNFIQLSCNRDYKHIDLDFYRYGVSLYPMYPSIELYKIPRDYQNITNKHFPEFICDCIEKNNIYFFIHVDEYFIPRRSGYKKKHGDHDILVFGFDRQNQLFNVVGYTDNGVYEETTVEFYELEKAFKACTSQEAIYMLNRKTNTNFRFDVNLVLELLKEYYNSTNTSEKYSLFDNPASSTAFGIEVYSYIKKSLLLNDEIDIRYFHLLWEHKKCMTLRLDYMNGEQNIQINQTLIDKYKQIEQETLILRNVLLKYKLKKQSLLKKKSIELLNQIEFKEKKVLGELINNLSVAIPRG